MIDIEERLARLSPAKQALLRERLQSRQKERGSERTIHRQVMREGLPLSFAQERIWLHQQLVPGSVVYNRPANLRLRGALEIESLREALTQIVSRHESLRTTAGTVNGAPVQCIHAAGPVDLPLTDLSGETGPEERAQELAREEAFRPFDLEGDVMVRSRLLRIDREEHLLLLTFHHFAFDAWSNAVLLEELRRNYEASTAGVKGAGEALEIQYADFAAWDRSAGRVAALEAGRSYWKDEMADPPVLQLPTDFPRPAEPSEEADQVEVELSSELVAGLRRLAKSEQTTLFSVLLAGYSVLLHRYTGDDDIVVGCPVAGRNRVETEPMIGVFINTLALRSQLDPAESFRQVVRETGAGVVRGLRHQEVPFQLVVQDVLTDRDRSGSPLFQVMFVHEGFSTETGPAAGVTFEPEDIGNGATGVELTLELMESGGHVGGRLTYRRDLWERETMERMAGHLVTLLEAAAADPDEELSLLPLLSEGESRQLLVEWNDTAAEYPRNRCLHELVQTQAGQTPGAVALRFGERSLTFAELDRLANGLARRLVEGGMQPDTPVAVLLDRSPEMVVALLGILKAGGCYLPLDPSYPALRIEHMLSDSGASIVLTDETMAELVPDGPWQPLYLANIDPATEPPPPPEGHSSASLAYVIYTSGSTGKPKGVEISHRAVVNFLWSMQREPGLSAADRLLALTTISFDISLLELFLPLMNGAPVVIATREEARDGRLLAELLETCDITVMQATPATWQLLLDSGWEGRRDLRIFSGGEPLSRDLANQLLGCAGEVWNLYGPTETTVWSTCERIRSGNGVVSIGRPIANTRVYILDHRFQPVPLGLVGELFIAGDGLANGYRRQDGLTAERFLNISLPGGLSERVYRTGDLARWRPDGAIECLGRADSQIKLRGVRVELGEIEAELSSHALVRRALVVKRDDLPGGEKLVAYLLPENDDEQVDPAELRRFLQDRLPDYLVPSGFVMLDELPLTPNGKVNVRQLPDPELVSSQAEGTFVEPRTPTEELLAGIWKEVTGVQRLSMHDNFFALGGHSLLATQVVARLHTAQGVLIPVRDVFEAPTIALLAGRVADAAAMAKDETPNEGGSVSAFSGIAEGRI